MSRFLLALSLFAFAALALANEPANCDAPTVAKPGKASASTTDGEADAPAAQATMRPIRAGSTRPMLPRWQSLLPGMIR